MLSDTICTMYVVLQGVLFQIGCLHDKVYTVQYIQLVRDRGRCM